MSVSGLSSLTGVSDTATTTVSSSSKELEDEFLTLLVAQLEYQDPLNPVDSTQFTTQLAQFSQLEQLEEINTGITSLVAYQASLQNANLASLIGKTIGYEVEATDGTTSTASGTVTSVNFDSDGTYFVVDGKTQVALSDVIRIQ
jgi:flagellar basal-body rod modification protein FlgD